MKKKKLTKKIEKLNGATYTIKKFGGIRPLARAVKRAPAAVHAWKNNKEIPESMLFNVLIAAMKNGVVLSPRKMMARR